jgi:hypothetical protein
VSPVNPPPRLIFDRALLFTGEEMRIKSLKSKSENNNLRNNIILYTRKTADTPKSTVHIFVSLDFRTASDILIADSNKDHSGRITQSRDLNEGELHNEFHQIADAELEKKQATKKYGPNTHCHLEILKNSGAVLVACRLLSTKTINLDDAAVLLYKLTKTKPAKETDPAQRQVQKNEASDAINMLKKTLLFASKAKDAAFFDNFDGPDFFSLS